MVGGVINQVLLDENDEAVLNGRSFYVSILRFLGQGTERLAAVARQDGEETLETELA